VIVYGPTAVRVVDHPPYCLDLAPNDFHVSGFRKKHLARKQFSADVDVKQSITIWLQTLDTTFFYAKIQALVPQWDKCSNVSGDMEVSCALSAMNVPCEYRVTLTFTLSERLLS